MTEPSHAARRSSIGLALGGGAARGWAHIGVIRALQRQGIEPDIIAGTSVGAIVGAMFGSARIDAFEDWVRSLKRRDVFTYIDFALGNGGFVQGRRLMAQLNETLGVADFKELGCPLGVVATDLYSGQERWLREGDLATAVRASMALPGLFTPVQVEGEWLVDGGLVNPVPVSLCHAMGADRVIAVNLSGGLVGRRIQSPLRQTDIHSSDPAPAHGAEAATASDWWRRLTGGLRDGAETLQAQFESGGVDSAPGVFDVIATSINVMQDRITRSRMAGDPPDLIVTPDLAHIDLLELHRGEEAITEGAAAVDRLQPAIDTFLRD